MSMQVLVRVFLDQHWMLFSTEKNNQLKTDKTSQSDL